MGEPQSPDFSFYVCVSVSGKWIRYDMVRTFETRPFECYFKTCL